MVVAPYALVVGEVYYREGFDPFVEVFYLLLELGLAYGRCGGGLLVLLLLLLFLPLGLLQAV